MAYRVLLVLILVIISVSTEEETTATMTKAERLSLREEARRMFYHAYNAYMDNAYPADELMPLSCKGRWKGITPSRGDMDDALGNFSLTLVDSLDTLVVMGDFSEFSRAIKLVIEDVSFDQDIVVSVFETNIRMLGGLLSAHVLALTLQPEVPVLQWYGGELLALAEDLGRRLLPAFNTSTGIPHGKINLRHGIRNLQESRETCTACAGTMILEMAALSRLTGKPVYEQKAHKAMDRLWKIRHRTSDLMGTVINIHSGDWVRKDSGVGAGIDSYYEYCLKAYILLGDEKYLARFNRHYNAVMKYISRGPVMLAVHMHRPHLQSRNFMDALLAFWPGLQVLLGDVRPAVETHEMLYQVMQRHTFLPEAFTTDFQVHWGQHPLRPEFLESTYFLHRATEDDHYLHVGKTVLKALQQYTKVPCGYAAVNDVRTRVHEDRMDSFVLAETFKYLYMLFGDDKDLPVKLEDYVLTTEAHFLPLSLAHAGRDTSYFTLKLEDEDEDKYRKTCPNTASLVAEKVRQPMRQLLGASAARPAARLRPLNDPRQLHALADMGISVLTLPDGRVQLLYTTNTAKSSKDAAEGLTFMREMSKWNSLSDSENGVVAAGVALRGRVLPAGPGHFGREVRSPVTGSPATADPQDACAPLTTPLTDKFAVAFRGHCTFAQKVRNLQNAGAKLAIIVDNVPDSTHETTAMFAMSGDGKDDIEIPAVFLFSREGAALAEAMKTDPDLTVTVGELKTLKRQIENVCDEGECDSGIDTAATPDPESFDHLKKVLSQLVAQFELSLTHEEGTGERCGRASPLEGPSYINEANKLLPAAPESGPVIRTAPLTKSGLVIGTAPESCPGSGTETESGPVIRTAPLTVSGHVIGTAPESCPGSGTETESGPVIRTAPLTVSGHVIGTASESCPGSGIDVAPETESGPVIRTKSGPVHRTVTEPKYESGPVISTESGPGPNSGTALKSESGPVINTESGPGPSIALESESGPVINTESGPGHGPAHVTKPDHL